MKVEKNAQEKLYDDAKPICAIENPRSHLVAGNIAPRRVVKRSLKLGNGTLSLCLSTSATNSHLLLLYDLRW